MNINIFFITIFKLINLKLKSLIQSNILKFFNYYLININLYFNILFSWLNKNNINNKQKKYIYILLNIYLIKYIVLYLFIHKNKLYKQYGTNKIYKTLYTLLISPLSDKKARSQYVFVKHKLNTNIPFWIEEKNLFYFLNYYSLDSVMYLTYYTY